jgi:hypothetical protein
MPLIARTKSAKPIAKKDSLKKATNTAKAKVTKAKAAKDSPAKKAETKTRAPKSDFENGWSEAKADPSVSYSAPSSSVNSTPAKRKTQIKTESDDDAFEVSHLMLYKIICINFLNRHQLNPKSQAQSLLLKLLQKVHQRVKLRKKRRKLT